jgi:hypothetical protein
MEREKEERFTTHAVAKFEKYGSGEIGDIFMKNLSKSGALFSNSNPTVSFIKGDLIRCIVALKDIGRERIVNAEVVWVKGTDMGVSFVNPDDIWSRLLARN